MSGEESARFLNLEAAAMENAGRGIQALLILNGGACLGLLSLYGMLATSDEIRPEFVPFISSVGNALGYFATGAGMTIFLWLFAYFANQNYANSYLEKCEVLRDVKWSHAQVFNKLAVIVVAISTALFFMGLIKLICNAPVLSMGN